MKVVKKTRPFNKRAQPNPAKARSSNSGLKVRSSLKAGQGLQGWNS
jgi:hypothetical protein